MPYKILLSQTPAGIAMETSSGVEGEPGRVAVREFTSSEDGELFISRLEGLPSQWLAMIRSHAPPSTIDHLVAIIRRDRSATLWVNECAVMLRMRAARSVQAGEAVYENDLVDVDALTFEGVEFPKDAGFLCVFSAGWRKGLFFDFGPILPEPVPLEYDVSKTLGSCMAYLWSQRVFSLDGQELEATDRSAVVSICVAIAAASSQARGVREATARSRSVAAGGIG